MTPALLLRRPTAVLLALTAALLVLPACKPGATAQNNTAAAPIVDGNFDDANFVVPDDEGSGDENVLVPSDPANLDSAAGGSSAHGAPAHGSAGHH